MRNAAMVLGIIGGIVGMIVGFFGYGFTVVVDWMSDVPVVGPTAAQEVDVDGETIRFVGLVAPILAIAGGAMAPSRPLLGGALMGASAAGMFHGFSFNLFTMFPIAMCGLACFLALLGGLIGKPGD